MEWEDLLSNKLPKVKMTTFESIFKSNSPKRDKYLSRLFGIFNEEVIRIWAKHPDSPYEDLGRPTLRRHEKERGYTLDFTLKDNNNKIYICEMKCLLEYQNYKFLRLNNPDLLNIHKGPAFSYFLDSAIDPHLFSVHVSGNLIEPDGCILIWGAVTETGRNLTKEKFHLHDVLSVENAIQDLQRWDSYEWYSLINGFKKWSNDLFDFLANT